jgi:hypothetical protein
MENRITFYLHKMTTIAALVVTTSLCTCTEEEIQTSVVRFDKETQNITEGSDAQIILVLDKPAHRSCSVKVKLETNAVYGDHFISTPEVEEHDSFVVIIDKGKTSVSFSIKSINNNLFDNGKYILFKLMDPDGGLALGTVTTCIATITDDERPTAASFRAEKWAVEEFESNGVVVEISLSAPTKGEGSLTINLTPYQEVYGEHFTTIPSTINNSITILIPPNATSTSFMILPVDDDTFRGNFELHFSISGVSGVLQKGTITKLLVTVYDDEQLSTALFSSETETLKEDDLDGIPVEIALSGPVAGTGTAYVSFITADNSNAIYGKDFETIPPAVGNTLMLPISFHDEKVSFKVLPIHNSTCPNRYVTMAITGINGPVVYDETMTSTIKIIDSDRSIVAFEEADASIIESETSGINVHLSFSKPAVENATLFISGPSYVGEELLYGKLYLTNPPMEPDGYDMYLPVSVEKGEAGADFTIIPTNNNVDTTDSILVFSFSFSTNYCFEANENYTLTIKDDD